VGQYSQKRFRENGARNPQFLPEQNGELVQQFFTMRSKFYKDFTAVLFAVPACHPSALHEAVNQLNRTVMAKTKSLRKRTHGGTSSLGQSFDGEQELVLLRFDALGPGDFFAYMQKLADAVAKFGKLAIARSRNISMVCSRLNAVVAQNHS